MGGQKKIQTRRRRKQAKKLRFDDAPVEAEEIIQAIKDAITASFNSPNLLAQVRRGVEEGVKTFFDKRFNK